jgi:hypothetical protein
VFIFGLAYISIELFEMDSGTKLAVTNIVIEDFDETIISMFKTESFQAGWNYFIEERLATFLN